MPHELMVFVKSKELCSYIMTVTDHSPKKFRFTFTVRMQNMALDVLESLYLANETYVISKSGYNMRRLHHNDALTKLKLLGYFAKLAFEQRAMTMKQFEMISGLCSDCQNLTGAWIKSDKKAFKEFAPAVSKK